MQTGDIKAAGLRLYEYAQTYSDAGLEQSRLWPIGTLCITIAANIGDTAILGVPACFPDSIVGFTAFKDVADPLFVKYILDVAKQRFTAISRGATQDNLSLDKLLSQSFSVPPFDEQRRIAAILGTYDDLIEVNRRRVALLEDMSRGLFEEWFVRFCFPGHENVAMVDTPDGPLPEGWSHKTLGELADIQWGDTSTTKSAYSSDGYRAYSASGPDGRMPTFDFNRTGVVLSAIGAKCGKTWLARGQWSCIKNTMRFWARDKSVSTEYLFMALADPDKWPKRGAAQPFISLGDARRIKLMEPDPTISVRFGAMAEVSLELVDNLRSESERLASSRDLLLPRLISGQLSVAAAERELLEAA